MRDACNRGGTEGSPRAGKENTKKGLECEGREQKDLHCKCREREQSNNSPFKRSWPFQGVVRIAARVKVEQQGLVDAVGGTVELGVLTPRSYPCRYRCSVFGIALGPHQQQRLGFVRWVDHIFSTGMANRNVGRQIIPIDLDSAGRDRVDGEEDEEV